MSADEDTELRDLVAQTLESNGVLGKIRAQLRASVFLALEEQDSVQNKTPFLNQDLKKFLTTKEGHTAVELVREFLDFFNLEYSQAVFEPEAGCTTNYEGRNALEKELNVTDTPGAPKLPLLAELLKRSQGEKTAPVRAALSDTKPPELTPKQLTDARNKFDYYDRDKNNEIDKEELQELFTDLFPNFNRNMLDRYVNDEFRAADRDISNSISFQEFVSMYKRLFLQCRSVVSGEVQDILQPASSHRSANSQLSKASNSDRSDRSLVDSRNRRNLENGPKQMPQENNNTDTEEDFFDDPVPTSPGYKAFGSGNKLRQGGMDKALSQRMHQCKEKNWKDLTIEKQREAEARGRAQSKGDFFFVSDGRSDEKPGSKSPSNTARSPGPSSGTGGGGMSSLQGLPSLTSDRKTTGRKSPQDRSDLLRSDKRMAELGLEGDIQDYSYEDDFQSEGHSMSQKSPRNRSEAKSQNGSIAEEIEEDIDELSIEADLLPSEKSAFDDVTTDRTISAHEAGFDYIEELQSP